MENIGHKKILAQKSGNEKPVFLDSFAIWFPVAIRCDLVPRDPGRVSAK
jgi:hypothetical protein